MNNTILQALREDANNLIRAAQANNAVVTITLEPQQPLAMGSYAMVADVRPARQRASTGFDLDAMCREAMTRLSDEISADARAHKRALMWSYTETKQAIFDRHNNYRKETWQTAWLKLTTSGFNEAAASLRGFAEAINRLNRPAKHNRDGSRSPFPSE